MRIVWIKNEILGLCSTVLDPVLEEGNVYHRTGSSTGGRECVPPYWIPYQREVMCTSNRIPYKREGMCTTILDPIPEGGNVYIKQDPVPERGNVYHRAGSRTRGKECVPPYWIL